MEEQQIYSKPAVVDAQVSLATDESEVVAQLQHKVDQVLDQSLFEF